MNGKVNVVKSHKQHHLARKSNFGRGREMLSSSVAKHAYSFRSSTGETEEVNFYEFEGNLVYLHRKIQANQGYTMRSSLKSEGPLAEE